MLWGYIFWLLFVGATIFVIRQGSRPHRQAIGVMLFGVIATTIIYIIGSHKWLPLNIAVTAIDIIALILFIVIAVRSGKFWTLLLAGWQLATVMIHIASFFARHLVPDAYGISQGLWANLQFVTIFGATLIEHRKAMRASSQAS